MYVHTCTSVDLADLHIHVQNTHIQDWERWRQPGWCRWWMSQKSIYNYRYIHMYVAKKDCRYSAHVCITKYIACKFLKTWKGLTTEIYNHLTCTIPKASLFPYVHNTNIWILICLKWNFIRYSIRIFSLHIMQFPFLSSRFYVVQFAWEGTLPLYSHNLTSHLTSEGKGVAFSGASLHVYNY